MLVAFSRFDDQIGAKALPHLSSRLKGGRIGMLGPRRGSHHRHIKAKRLCNERRKLFVGDVGLRLHHTHDTEKHQAERLRNQLNVNGSLRHIFRHDVALNAGDAFAHGPRCELIAHPQLFKHSEHGARLSRARIQRASERGNAVLQL